MTLRDTMNGSVWLLWVVIVLLAASAVWLLTGHGANLIAGYNTAGEEEKNKYDEKKLCRVIGGGLAVIAAMIFVMAIGLDRLPASFAKVFFTLTLLDIVLTMILTNTVCKKQQ